ncbi:SGNH/GDSL hydrolase family protein [Fundicoccus ignavus]|uniref:SGNH hydrolase n=1 Tax=Fundicoccus ignavus TaxID=2664442 RepID=A0A844CCR4_9LACT|nr:SGNH/GDSL hydrolase family protein [Fundicoccus ignavus]MRJ46970.1 SGNH hydrolase [Fundicoccus ignavus]
MLFEKKDRLLFMGDSITDSGRNYDAMPAGWSSWGDGYVNLLNAYTTALLPETELMVVNRGVSGNTIVDMAARWQTDALDFQADWITIMIGVNDVWRHYDGTFPQVVQVDAGQFEQVYRELIEVTLPKVKGIILLSPFMVEGRLDDPMRQQVDKYRAIVEKLAADYQLPYGNVQAKVDEFLQHQSSYVLSSDRVHPSLAGHLLIAQAW